MATITFIRADKQTIKFPIEWSVTWCSDGAKTYLTPIPTLSDDDTDTLFAFCNERVMSTVQYLYAEAGMTRLFRSSADRSMGEDGCSWFII